MIGRKFMNAIANGETDILQTVLDILAETGAEYCVIGGLAVNAYVEPVVSLDLDVVVAAEKVEAVAAAAAKRGLTVERFEHSINLTSTGSDLRVQIQTDERYQAAIPRATEQDVLGYRMRVATVEDVLQGKIWAWLDETRRPSKRQKDLADILRLVETSPALEDALPPEIREKLA